MRTCLLQPVDVESAGLQVAVAADHHDAHRDGCSTKCTLQTAAQRQQRLQRSAVNVFLAVVAVVVTVPVFQDSLL